MKLNETSLTIPQPIMGLDNVTASEKLLLSLYAVEPDAKNFRALKVLNVGLTGLKKIKRRLLAKGLLRCKAKGYEVILPALLPGPEDGGHLVAKSGASEKENKVAPSPSRLKKERPLVEKFNNHLAAYSEALRNQDGYSATRHLLAQNFLDFVTNEVPPSFPGRDEALATLTTERDRWFAASYAADNLPRNTLRKVARVIGKATPQQLAALRTTIDQAQLTGAKPVLLLERLSGPAKPVAPDV